MTENATVVGLGYIGLPTAVVVAQSGLYVTGCDVSAEIVAAVNSGKAHIVEPGLNDLLSEVVRRGALTATQTPQSANTYVIAVPTPVQYVEGEDVPQSDLSYVMAAIGTLLPILKCGDLLIIESTCPVGTTDLIVKFISQNRPDLLLGSTESEMGVGVAYCPERVIPGQMMREVIENDRIIGGLTPRCAVRARDFYKRFVHGECRITTARTAEMSKLTENAFRDVNIAFANELSMICEEQDVDVWELIELANLHPRVSILEPGPGVGGHCIAVDPWFLVASSPKISPLIRTAREVNDRKPHWVLDRIRSAIQVFQGQHMQTEPANSPKPKVVIFGLAFKPDIDDFRHSPAVEILNTLKADRNIRLSAVEPNLTDHHFNDVPIEALDDACETADIAVMLVNHKEFYASAPRTPFQVDTKGIWR